MRNRVLYTEEVVRRMFARMKDELREMGERHLAQVAALRDELANLQAELAEVCREHAELRAAVLARTQAEAELASLYRERDIARAKAVERDPALPLH